MIAPRLLASSATFDGIRALVSEFYHVTADLISGPDGWRVFVVGKERPGVRVIHRKGRYRFEMVTAES